jgi:hypothetical protein
MGGMTRENIQLKVSLGRKGQKWSIHHVITYSHTLFYKLSFWVVLEFEVRASDLLGRCSITSAIPPAHVVSFWKAAQRSWHLSHMTWGKWRDGIVWMPGSGWEKELGDLLKNLQCY